MKPILFNTEMVQAILDGRKTQTRRLIKPRYKDDEYGFNVVTNSATGERWIEKYDEDEGGFENTRYVNPLYKVGDVLYVRETWMHYDAKIKGDYIYKAGISSEELSELSFLKWKPSLHMPKEAARIFLKVTGVRVEKLQDMKVGDVIKEGVYNDNEYKYYGSDRTQLAFELWEALWDSTIDKNDNDLYGWSANPWVWVYEFEPCDKPEVDN